MKKMLRQLTALVFAVLLVCQWAAPAPKAVLSGVYFTGVNDNLLELNSESMPFWSGGELYVSNAVFMGTDLGVFYSRSFDKQTVMLYTLRRTLSFDLPTGECYDQDNKAYNAKLITRGDYVFFPLSVVADFFGLTWTYNRTAWVPLIRIKSPSVLLSDEIFLDAAKDMMRSRYTAYEKTVTANQDLPPAVSPTQGQRVYLLLSAADAASTGAVLDTLGQYSKQATVIMTVEQMAGQSDLLRRMVAQGHALAIAPGGATEAAVTDELAEANRILWDAACARTRLVYLAEEQEKLRETVETLGYTVCRVDIDNSRYPLDGTRRVNNLYSDLSGYNSSDICVYLGETAENVGGLAVLMSRLQSGGCRVIAYRETLG